MNMQKGFLMQKRYKPKSTRRRLIVGAILSVGFAVSFYSFLYVIREVLRVLSVNDYHDIWLLTDKAVSFYNLLFAFLALIFAQSVFIIIAYDKPRGIRQGRRYHRFSILNDQRVINLYFLDWFSKMAIFYWMLFGDIMKSGYMTFSLFPDYAFMFVLMILVLFFHTWITLRRCLGKPGLKWMLISFLIITAAAFALSRFNPVDYKAINRAVLSHNAFVMHNIELPETDECTEFRHSFYLKNLFVIESQNPKDTIPILIIDNEQISIQELQEKIIASRSMYGEWDYPRLTIQIFADKDIPMKYVNQVREVLIKSKALRVAYAVVPETREYPKAYYRDMAVLSKLPYCCNDTCIQQQIDGLKDFSQIIDVYPLNNMSVVNDSLIPLNQFNAHIKSLINENPDYVIVFHVSDKLRYADFITHYAEIRSAINDLRELESQKRFGKSIDDVNGIEAEEIKQKYALRVFEITDALSQHLEILNTHSNHVDTVYKLPKSI
jgi:biopolymer transport protein ExbD